MAGPRVLTFNFHEPYLCLMAKTGLPFTIGLYNDAPLARSWQVRFRPVPRNMVLVQEHAWRRDLAAGRYDVVIAQNETNAINIINQCKAGALLVCHNRRSFLRTTLSDQETGPATYDRLLTRLREKFGFVFISESKRADYGIPGRVIVPGIDVEEYGGYRGEVGEVLRVGNMMRARDLMFDVDFQETVCRDFPNRVVGEDPTIPGAKPSTSFEDLLETFRSLRCLLHVTREDWEDGYNLSMLEAMACGMPVVALANRTSPLTDGVDGFASHDADVLRERLRQLLADPELAREIGARGRETVAQKFPIAAFAEQWREAIEEAAETNAFSAGQIQPGATVPPARSDMSDRSDKSDMSHTVIPRQNILMSYVASPITTARYFERAARKRHRVLTAGFRVPEGVLERWQFGPDAPFYPPHQIDLPLEFHHQDILDRLPPSFVPSLYFWVDSGPKKVPGGIHLLNVPKVCYLIDTHLALQLRLDMARQFDFTFLAQKGQLQAFVEAGIPNVAWLPLACSPELHAVGSFERVYDVAYVGRLDDELGRRRPLFERVKAHFPNTVVRQCWPEDMAQTYAQAKIVVNACVNRDVNMCVFEAMASGALLITDEADGLEDLFEDGKHLVVYRNDNELLPLIQKYLADDAARERIATAGRELVLSEHTYDRRIEQMLECVLAVSSGKPAPDSRFQSGGYYRSARPELLQHVPATARRVLDCGCGAGDFGRAMKERGAHEVVGIEIVEKACALARQVLDDALLGNIEEMELPFKDGHFDCVCFADVLEHLVDPVAVLKKARRVLAPDGVMVMSIPNVRFGQVVEMLANGRWKYEDAGILDRTHLRFFTAFEMREMIKAAGLKLIKIAPLSMLHPEQMPRNADGSLTLGRMTLSNISDAEYVDFLVYQYLVIAGNDGVEPLSAARQALDEKDFGRAYELAQAAEDVNDFERLMIMAKAIARIGKLDTAEDLYRAALALRPTDAAALGDLGILLVGMNRAGDALPYLESAVEADPQHHRALGALGLALWAQGKKADAFDRLMASLDLNSDSVPLLSSLIQAAYELNKLSEAEPVVRRFADLSPANFDMTYNFAGMLYKLGKFDEAKERLETILILSPEHTAAQELLTLIEQTEGG